MEIKVKVASIENKVSAMKRKRKRKRVTRVRVRARLINSVRRYDRGMTEFNGIELDRTWNRTDFELSECCLLNVEC